MKQEIVRGLSALSGILDKLQTKHVFLVCGGSFDRLELRGAVPPPDVTVTRFSAFTPNPRYEDICRAVELYRASESDTIIAVGGGSAIDTAKCVKLFLPMNPNESYLSQPHTDSGVPLIAVPTTAGTGSESTCHAVIYAGGEKQSITEAYIVPDYAVLEPSLLKSLPEYQKKCALLDALCQGIESWWSVHSTEESLRYAREAVTDVLESYQPYLAGESAAAGKMMLAANASGRAINLTATTAPHAMSYKLTSLYGLPHGHAVALCLPEVWDYILAHTAQCTDHRGACHLKQTLAEIGRLLTPEAFRELLAELGMESPHANEREAELALLADAVNPERLKNNPVPLSREVLRELYERIVR